MDVLNWGIEMPARSFSVVFFPLLFYPSHHWGILSGRLASPDKSDSRADGVIQGGTVIHCIEVSFKVEL